MDLTWSFIGTQKRSASKVCKTSYGHTRVIENVNAGAWYNSKYVGYEYFTISILQKTALSNWIYNLVGLGH